MQQCPCHDSTLGKRSPAARRAEVQSLAPTTGGDGCHPEHDVTRSRALLGLDDVAFRSGLPAGAASPTKRADSRRYHLGVVSCRRRDGGGRRGHRDPAAPHPRPARRAGGVRDRHCTLTAFLLLQHEAQPAGDVGELVDRLRDDAVRHLDARSRRFCPGRVGAHGPVRRDVELYRGRFPGRRLGGRDVAHRIGVAPPGRGGPVPGFRRGGVAARLPDAHPAAVARGTDRGAEDAGRARRGR